MIKKWVSCVLCCALLLSLTVTVSAKTVYFADVTKDQICNMMDVITIYRIVGGWKNATAAEKAVADCNQDGEINIADVAMVYGYVSGGNRDVPEAIAFTPWYIDAADTAEFTSYDYDAVTVLYTLEDFRTFRNTHAEHTSLAWYGNYDIVKEENALIAVPMMQDGESVVSVMTDDDTVYVTMLTASPIELMVYHPEPYRTAFALIEVLESNIVGKTVQVVRHYDSNCIVDSIVGDAVTTDWQYPDFYNGNADYQVTVLENLEDVATFYAEQTVPDDFFAAFDDAFFQDKVLMLVNCTTVHSGCKMVGASDVTVFCGDRILLTAEYEMCVDPYRVVCPMLYPYSIFVPLPREYYRGESVEVMFRCRVDACCREDNTAEWLTIE